MENSEELVIISCERCGNEFQLKMKTKARRERKNIPLYCRKCMNLRKSETMKNRLAKLSPKELQEFKDKRNWYSRLSVEEKEAHAQRTRDQLAKRTPEEWAEINKKNSEGLKRHWKTVSDDDKSKRVLPMVNAIHDRWDSMTPEEKHEQATRWCRDKSDDELREILKQYSARMSEYNDSLSIEEKQSRAENMQRWRTNLSPDEKKAFYMKTHQWYYDLPDDEKERISNERRRQWEELSDEEKEKRREQPRIWWDGLSDEERTTIIHHRKQQWENMDIESKKAQVRKALRSSHGINRLHKRFEKAFGSYLGTYFFYISEYPTSYCGVMHCWDYAIFDENGKLQMLVDLDGAYFHADMCDYDGFHSREEYDEKRGLSIPDGVKWCIINELNFNKCFSYTEKCLVISYDEFIEQRFREYRLQPFPEPEYTDVELLKSYNLLQYMKTDDKYHQNMNLNTRNGDRIIQHFHHSLYDAQCEVWKDDKILRKLINERAMYQCYLNRNKILQGLNVSQIVPSVRYMSAGKAKMIVSRYLSDYDTIFDPNMGWGGRMLGVMSLGKHYVGLDDNEVRVNETMRMLEFLREHGIDFHVTLNSSDMEYDCLFTECAEDEIQPLMDRCRCKRYVFVVNDDVTIKEGA